MLAVCVATREVGEQTQAPLPDLVRGRGIGVGVELGVGLGLELGVGVGVGVGVEAPLAHLRRVAVLA